MTKAKTDREKALERMTVDYEVTLDRQPDAAEDEDHEGDDDDDG
jgi:hypothetical protein